MYTYSWLIYIYIYINPERVDDTENGGKAMNPMDSVFDLDALRAALYLGALDLPACTKLHCWLVMCPIHHMCTYMNDIYLYTHDITYWRVDTSTHIICIGRYMHTMLYKYDTHHYHGIFRCSFSGCGIFTSCLCVRSSPVSRLPSDRPGSSRNDHLVSPYVQELWVEWQAI